MATVEPFRCYPVDSVTGVRVYRNCVRRTIAATHGGTFVSCALNRWGHRAWWAMDERPTWEPASKEKP